MKCQGRIPIGSGEVGQSEIAEATSPWIRNVLEQALERLAGREP